MNEKLTSLAQLRMTAEKSKELSAQVASAMAEAVEELDASKAAVEHTHTAEQVGALPADETNKPYEFISSSGTKCSIYGGEVKFSSHDENSITRPRSGSRCPGGICAHPCTGGLASHPGPYPSPGAGGHPGEY